MARRPKTAEGATATAGHNVTPLTDDEAAALTTHFALKVIEAERKAAVAKVDYDNARSVVSGQYKLIAKELKFTRKEFEAEVIAKMGMTETEYRNSEVRRDRLHRLAGLKPGEQIDLIAHVLADTVDEGELAFADGYRAGRRADDPKPPSHVSGIMQPKWMEGWHAGQAFNGEQLKRAHEIMARPKPGQMAAAPEGEGDEGTSAETDPEADIDAEVKRLEREGWASPTEAEAKFEEADNGRTIRAINEAA